MNNPNFFFFFFASKQILKTAICSILKDHKRQNIWYLYNISHWIEQIQQDNSIYKLRHKLGSEVFYRNEWKQDKYFNLYAYLHCTKVWCRRKVCCIITKEIYLKLDGFSY